MVGDSFVFGVPIEDDEKIFPRLLQKKLGERYELISVAFPGANTAQEIRLLAQADGVYGFDHAVLFFFPNDVEREGDPRRLSFYGHLVPGEAGKYLSRIRGSTTSSRPAPAACRSGSVSGPATRTT